MKAYFAIMALSLFCACDKISSTSAAEKEQKEIVNYVEAQMTVEDYEANNPTEFLRKSNGTYRKNLINEWVLEGEISNKASKSTYKDVTIVLRFWSKTQTFMGEENHTIYEFFAPGASTSYKIKTSSYPKANSVSLEVYSAKVK